MDTGATIEIMMTQPTTIEQGRTAVGRQLWRWPGRTVDTFTQGCGVPSDKWYRIQFQGDSERCVTMAISSKTLLPPTFKGIGDNYTAGCIRSLRKRVTYSRIISLGTIKRDIEKMATSYCYFQNGIFLVGLSRSGVGAGLGVDISRPESKSELELLEIRRLRSPAFTPTLFFTRPTLVVRFTMINLLTKQAMNT